jgi:hypothetical protein
MRGGSTQTRTSRISICSSNPEMFSASAPCSRLSSWATRAIYRYGGPYFVTASTYLSPHLRCRKISRDRWTAPSFRVSIPMQQVTNVGQADRTKVAQAEWRCFWARYLSPFLLVDLQWKRVDFSRD